MVVSLAGETAGHRFVFKPRFLSGPIFPSWRPDSGGVYTHLPCLRIPCGMLTWEVGTPYNIFRKTSETPLAWVSAAENIDEAKKRLVSLATTESGDCFISDPADINLSMGVGFGKLFAALSGLIGVTILAGTFNPCSSPAKGKTRRLLDRHGQNTSQLRRFFGRRCDLDSFCTPRRY